jgi:murein DD-endopeptidase MepM/ murein hydrolase activator NlpD
MAYGIFMIRCRRALAPVSFRAGRTPGLAAAMAALLSLSGAPADPAGAQGLYRYQDSDGHWHFSDRPPPGAATSPDPLPRGADTPAVALTRIEAPPGLRVANGFHMPVQLALAIEAADGSTARREALIAPMASLELPLPALISPAARWRHAWVPGDPAAVHRPPGPYRAPFAVASRFRITQSFGDGITHLDASSRYAVDVAMPVGTAVMAARGGTVVEIAWANYAGGTDAERDGPRANLVRILHDDGTFALYAHLDRSSVSVRPGDRVERGEQIAASGNTGFSSGPHLHFAVLRNAGLRVVSVPFEFQGPGGGIVPRRDRWLTAYP